MDERFVRAKMEEEIEPLYQKILDVIHDTPSAVSAAALIDAAASVASAAGCPRETFVRVAGECYDNRKRHPTIRTVPQSDQGRG